MKSSQAYAHQAFLHPREHFPQRKRELKLLLRRRFHEFDESELPQRWHEALIESTQKERLIGHIARDSTAIEARERFLKSAAQAKARKTPKRPSLSSTPRVPRSRIEEQRSLTVAEMLPELPRRCSLGVKRTQ